MASSESFMNGLISAVVGILFSTILFFGFGLPMEKMVASFEGTTLYDVPEKWASYDDVKFWMNMMYIIIISPALIGIITLFLSAIKTQDYDVISEPDAQPSPEGTSMAELQYQYAR